MHVFREPEGILITILLMSTQLEMETILNCGKQDSALAFLEKHSAPNILAVQEK